MSAEAISPEARRFISTYITSVAQLEMLLLLRTRPQQAWSVEELARELRIEPAWARSQLRVLCDFGLLRCEDQPQPQYQYMPAGEELDRGAAAVAQAYLLHRVSVVELIYGESNSTIRALSDAFQIRKERPSG